MAHRQASRCCLVLLVALAPLGCNLQLGTPSGVADGGVLTPIPTKVDCTVKTNCYHLACWDDPSCVDVPSPGGCAQGSVKDISSGACRACTVDDCDGLTNYCCGTDVCVNSVACNNYRCKDIEASCAGVTAESCGFHDLDGDDAWGDCDEAPRDPCCWCKVAVGCADSACKVGDYVDHGDCRACTGATCDRLSCMGLHGCATGCPGGQYFDGVRCRDCQSSSSAEMIPACALPDGGVWSGPPLGAKR
ncbi:MAG: hypothetical protein NVSMB47_16550 [Polyangiales bacterium]